MKSGHSAEYTRYLGSPEWRRVRADALLRAEYRCEACGVSDRTVRLEAHHVTYERLGREQPQDLQALCPSCHAEADRGRATRSKQRSAERLWKARVHGWAAARWGEDWLSDFDWWYAEEAFREWLDARDDT